MTVLENVALGMDAPGPLPALAVRVREVSHGYGLPLDPVREVRTLSVGERQRIEIVRCLLQAPRLLIMDEPTSVLTPQEVGRLFGTLRRLAREGCSILYISHKLDEIRAICDRATVLRGGRVVGTADPSAETAATLARMMIGADLRRPARSGAEAPAARRPRLVLNGLTLPADAPYGTDLRHVALEVRSGEIVGIAGVAGNGQNELFAVVSGERLAVNDDDVMVDEAPVGWSGADARRRRGLCCVPEERNGHAAVPAFSLAENAVLSAWRRAGLSRLGVILPGAARAFAQRVIETFGVRCGGAGAAAGSLSGGNLQKFIVGREVLQEPGALVVSQPPWGVDAGAAAVIHRELIALASRGAAVLVISQDLDELLALCDRLAVLNVGRLSRAQPAGEMTVEALGLLMGGVHGDVERTEEAAAHAA